jgi:hypothetical protein
MLGMLVGSTGVLGMIRESIGKKTGNEKLDYTEA